MENENPTIKKQGMDRINEILEILKNAPERSVLTSMIGRVEQGAPLEDTLEIAENLLEQFNERNKAK